MNIIIFTRTFSEPQINTEDISYNITNCSNAMKLDVQLTVSSDRK